MTSTSNLLLHDLRKFIAYYFESKGFGANTGVAEISAQASQAAQSIRGAGREPAVIIQGVMPRCGSVYVGELLRLHPDLYAYPHQFWEFPALQLTEDVLRLQQKFELAYKPNLGKLGQNDFIPLFGAALIAYLYSPVPSHQRVLAKMPSVQYLSHFHAMFPHENLLILVRDGRDLVHSTLRTWPRLNFIQVCLRWNRSAQMVLDTVRNLEATGRRGWCFTRYEDALEDPQSFVRAACMHFGLDETSYPFERIDDIRVIGSSKLEQNRGEVQWRHLKTPKDFRPVKYWQQWSASRKLIFKAIAGRSLLELGYCDDLRW